MQRVGSPSCGNGVVRRGKPSVDFTLDEFGVLEQGQHLLPHRLVEFVGTHRRVVAHRALWTAPALGAVTSIVMSARCPAASRPGVPSHGVPTMRADTKPLEKRLLGSLAYRKALIGRPLLLCTRKQCLVNDRGNGQLDPFLPRAGRAPDQAPHGATLLSAGAIVPGAFARTHALQVGRFPDVGLVSQNDRYGRAGPMPRMARAYALRIESGADLVHFQPLAHIELKDPAHHAGFGVVDLEARPAGLGLAEQAVSVRRSREHVQRALTGTMDLAPTRALGDLCALVFGDHRQDLAQQHAMRGGVVGLLDAHDLRTGAGELFLQQDLMGKVAAQPVDRPHQHGLDLAARDAVAERFKRRTLEGRAAEAVIGKHAGVGDRPATPAGMVQNSLTLTGDRVALSLSLARHPQVRRHRRWRACYRCSLHLCGFSSWTRCVREPGRHRLR